jgi:hypothetical protein
VAEDLMEDGTVSRISNAYSLRRGRKQPPTSKVEELQLYNCNCNVKEEIKNLKNTFWDSLAHMLEASKMHELLQAAFLRTR